MSDKSNEEKLKILQERLAHINKKNDSKTHQNESNEKSIDDNKDHYIDEETDNNEERISSNQNTSTSFLKIISLIIFISLISIFGYYFATNNFNLDSTISKLKSDFENITTSFVTPEDKENQKEDEIKEEKKAGDNINELIYKSSDDLSGFIIIVNSYVEDSLPTANEESEKLKDDGYDAGIIFLPNHSNSEEKVYQTYIGPFKMTDYDEMEGNKIPSLATQYLESYNESYAKQAKIEELQ